MPLILRILSIAAFSFSGIYLILIIFFYSGFRKLKAHELKSDEELPELTVIVCAKDEEEHIGITLNSILAQDYPKEKFSIIAVNDRSEDKTPELLDSLASKHDNITVLHISECPLGVSPKKNAIEQAIKECKTEFIVACDADIKHKSKWLRSYGSMCNDSLGCSTALCVLKKDSYLSKWEETWQDMQMIENLSYGVVNAGAMANGFPITAYGGNMMYRKELFKNDDALRDDVVTGDDTMIVYEAQRQKYDIVFNMHPEAVADVVPEDTIAAMINQRIRWASHTMKMTFPVVLMMLAIFFFYLSTFIFPLLGFININMLYYGLALFAVKACCDIFYMNVTLKRFDIPFKFKHLLLMELLHAPFIIWVGLHGTFGKFTWKGSTYKKTL